MQTATLLPANGIVRLLTRTIAQCLFLHNVHPKSSCFIALAPNAPYGIAGRLTRSSLPNPLDHGKGEMRVDATSLLSCRHSRLFPRLSRNGCILSCFKHPGENAAWKGRQIRILNGLRSLISKRRAFLNLTRRLQRRLMTKARPCSSVGIGEKEILSRSSILMHASSR